MIFVLGSGYTIKGVQFSFGLLTVQTPASLKMTSKACLPNENSIDFACKHGSYSIETCPECPFVV